MKREREDQIMQTSSIFDYDGDLIAGGLNSALLSDEALQAARRIAAHRGEAVVVEDPAARDVYVVRPDGTLADAPAGWTGEPTGIDILKQSIASYFTPSE